MVNLKEMKEQQCFSLLKYQKEQILVFHKILSISYKLEAQETINLLKDTKNAESKFATKWYVIDSQTAIHKYNQSSSVKFETENIKSL